ncbi:MAG: DUF547 domain-containing protein [Acidobacteria bacterium]|nr:DUF547 domain-containing protein [Acidobacteriota bacterium]
MLNRFVDDEGLVNYSALAEDREGLDRYLSDLSLIGPESHPSLFPTQHHELAYYLNAYNAFVFAGVLELGPSGSSVWGKSGLGVGFFVRRKYLLDGGVISLKKLEDEVIRAGFEDPRIHAALNCASLDCPKLSRRAFEGSQLSRQLDEALEDWLTSPKAVQLDQRKGVVLLSKIFEWFSDDFVGGDDSPGGKASSLISYLNRHRSPDAQIPRSYRVEFRPYDKRLNRQP